MHMADALLAPAVAGTMYVLSGTAAGLSVRELRKENAPEKLPVMAVTSALVFAGQMINYTIPGTGSSGHLCGGMLLSALLGPHAGFLSMIVILTIQCLFFADGGLMALGANVWNMAVYGCFLGYYLIWRPIMQGASPAKDRANTRVRIIAASIILSAGCRLNYHLSGSMREYNSFAPSNLLLYKVALWGCENGYKTLYLGGGVGSAEDSLLKFKKAFYRGDLKRYYIGKRIFDQTRYDELVALRGFPEGSFFPRYRSL